MDNLQLKSDPIPAVPAVPGATPAWMTLVTSLVASGAQIAAAVAQANAHTGTNIQLPPNYTLNVPPANTNNASVNTEANNNATPKSFMDSISTNTVIIIVAIIIAICGGAFFYFKSKKIV